MVAMFIIFPWSYISPVGNIAFDDSDFYDGVEQESWESEWIESEPSYVSSENGRGFSTTIEWLSVQHQFRDCKGDHCLPIDPTAKEWMDRDVLPALLIFSRPGPSIETQKELIELGIELQENPWRDSIDTPILDESRLVSSFDDDFIDDFTRSIISDENADFDINELGYSPPSDWSLGAWASWVQASVGSDRAALHAPFRDNPDYWRIGDVWFASVTTEDLSHLVSNNLWPEISVKIPSLMRIDLDLKIGIQPPLDLDRKWTGTDTQLEPGVPPAWNHSAYNVPLRGDSIRVADFDTGIDVFHPAFFNPSNTPTNWIDSNSNSVFDWGTDGIDYNGDSQLSTNEILLRIANGDGVDSINRDTYYLDLDQDGDRDHGTSSIYNDASPGFGEPMYQANDLNSDGNLSTNEHFLLLDESTILATYDPVSGERTRGTDLIQTAPDTNGHGTSVQGIIAANNEHHRFSGLAPNVDLLSHDSFAGGFANGQSWALQKNADVMLYEVGGWTNRFLDGTDAVEMSLDQMANAGVVQVNPAGNLGGSDKVMQGLLPDVDDSLGPLITKFGVSSSNTPHNVYLTYLVPNGHNISSVKVKEPGQSSFTDLSNTSSAWLPGGTGVVISKGTSARNTTMLYLWFGVGSSSGLITGDWEVSIAGPSGQGRVLFRATANQNAGTWSGGTTWKTPSPTSLAAIGDNGSVTWPATADSAITVASWASWGRAGSSAGELSHFSGRGTRIHDGRPMVDIASPGNYDIWSPKTNYGGNFGTYKWFGGTSAAGPGVAAIAALMIQDNPGIGHHRVWNILNATGHWNSTTGELWNYSSRLSGDVGEPTDVVGAVLLANGSWGLSHPYGTPLGNGVRAGDPMPGVHASDPDWGWGYIRADRATQRDTLPPNISVANNVSFESLEPTNITLNVDDNAIGDGNPITMNVTCLENQSGTNVVTDYQENIALGSINCTFEEIGWNSIAIEVTDYSNNKQNSTINVSTVFGIPVQLLSSSPTSLNVTTDDTFQIDATVRNAWGAERSLTSQEWATGLSLNGNFIIDSVTNDSVVIDPIKTGLHNLSMDLSNVSIWFEINVSQGLNHYAEFRIDSISNIPTNGMGHPIFSPDAPINFEFKWYDEDNNSGEWENYTGSQVGYVISQNNSSNYHPAVDIESNDTLVGHWNNGEFNPLREGEITLWVGLHNHSGDLVRSEFTIDVTPGTPHVLYLAGVSNNSMEIVAGNTFTSRLYAYDLANNTVNITNHIWELNQSSINLSMAQSGFVQVELGTLGHSDLTLNVTGEHVLVGKHTRLDGLELTLNLTVFVNPNSAESMIVHPSIVNMTAGNYFDINTTLLDQFGNLINTSGITITHTSGLCRCNTSMGEWYSTISGVEYIFLNYDGINESVEVRISPSTISMIEVGIGGNESMGYGDSRTLNITAYDEYNNSLNLNISEVNFTVIGSGLSIDGTNLLATAGGNHSINGQFINQVGDTIQFQSMIFVWGDMDGDGISDSIDRCPHHFGNSTWLDRLGCPPISMIDVGIGGNESMGYGDSRTLNITAYDEYNNSLNLNISEVNFTVIGSGLSIDGANILATAGGNHSINAQFINRVGDTIQFQSMIFVWGDSDGDGISDSIDRCPYHFGNSTWDRLGCIDEDGDGWSNPDTNWNVSQGADAFPSRSGAWSDSDFDGFPNQFGLIDSDSCEGHDDSIDLDNDGFVDGCDSFIGDDNEQEIQEDENADSSDNLIEEDGARSGFTEVNPELRVLIFVILIMGLVIIWLRIRKTS